MKRPAKRELPDIKNYPILPPDMDYLYFENSELFPFEIREKQFSLRNAWWLAESAFVAYCHPGFARMAFKIAGLNHFQFFQGTGTECMTAWNKKLMVVSFRGTELNSLSTLHEIGTDLNAIPVDFEPGGKVHQGFLSGLNEVWDGENGLASFIEGKRKENPERAIWITGHSLGGALAALCFARIPEAFGLYIYGSPRIGDHEFNNLLEGRPVFRMEHAADPIPLVPPSLPKIGFNFSDTGQLIFISKEGEVLFKKPELDLTQESSRIEKKWKENRKTRNALSLKVIERALKGENPEEKIRELNTHLKQSRNEWKQYLKNLDNKIGIKIEDHMPIYYAAKLWNQLIKHEEEKNSSGWNQLKTILKEILQ